MVLRGDAPAALLASYETERGHAADENIQASTRSTDFIAPHSQQERRLRSAVLRLAAETEFAKRMVNSGRLSVPSVYDTPLSTADADPWNAGPRPGAHMLDAPLARASGEPVYLTEAFQSAGGGFVVLESADGEALDLPGDVSRIRVGTGAPLTDPAGMFARRYDATPGSAYLLRPDGYVAARFKYPTPAIIAAAAARASGRG
jgi:3-(3-hydroxy-phenyl)propionate hydroxylase